MTTWISESGMFCIEIEIYPTNHLKEGARDMVRKAMITLMSVAFSVLAQSNAQAVFNRRAELDRTAVHANKDQEVHIVIRLDTPHKPNPGSRSRTPLNVGLVMDRSGSMAEKGKMEYAKEAARFIVNNVTANDRLSITEYDDRVNVLWPSSMVTSKANMKSTLNTLHPRGGTNLCGGMQEGIKETSRFTKEEKLNRVILLSDGLANQGITDRGTIFAFARDARRAGVTVSTIGLGIDYDEDLMQGIAEHGGGRYYYVESPAQMESIFQQELSSLNATVVQNIIIKFKWEDCVKDVKVYGYSASVSGSTATIPLSSFYAGEERTVMLKVKMSGLQEGKRKLGTVFYSWMDSESKKVMKDSYPVSIKSTFSKSELAASENKPVTAEVTLIEAEEEHEHSIRLFEQGQEQLAQQNMSALQSKLARVNSRLSNKRISKKMEAVSMEQSDMDRAARAPAAKIAYVKARKQTLYYAKKGQRGKYILEKGNSGSEVVKLQKALKSNSFYTGTVDGKYSGEVEEAVKRYQQANSLTDDGIAGPQTLRKLNLY